MAVNDINQLTENEAIFRDINEDIKEWEKNGGPEERNYNSTQVPFYCECSDKNCKETIEITPATYEDIHVQRKQFILKPGHEVPDIEEIFEEHLPDYLIVKKIKQPPEEPENAFRIV